MYQLSCRVVDSEALRLEVAGVHSSIYGAPHSEAAAWAEPDNAAYFGGLHCILRDYPRGI